MIRLFRRAAPAERAWNVELPVLNEARGLFAAERGRRVLIYWPHGLGDFVYLSTVIHLLEPSNEYFLTRFGDDFVHLYDGASAVRPIYSGVRRIGDGRDLGAAHFGLGDPQSLRNTVERMFVPGPLLDALRTERIDMILYPFFAEREGRAPYPWHTKARYFLSQAVSRERLAGYDLSVPLRSSLAFHAPAANASRVEARIREFVPSGKRLYLLSPGGHTQIEKIFPAHEVTAFERETVRRDPHAVVFVIDESTVAERFGDLDVPFAHVLVTLIRSAHAYAGVPSGPFHTALAARRSPVVGIWLYHWPEYYDEPSDDAIHLVGPMVYRRKIDRRIGARSKEHAGALPYRILPFKERPPAATDVLDALFSR